VKGSGLRRVEVQGVAASTACGPGTLPVFNLPSSRSRWRLPSLTKSLPTSRLPSCTDALPSCRCSRRAWSPSWAPSKCAVCSADTAPEVSLDGFCVWHARRD
jgi:hypothetical protein